MGELRCSLCQLGFADMNMWMNHVEEQHELMMMKCSLCSSELVGCLHRVHLDEQHRLSCPECAFSCFDPPVLLEHVASHQSPPLICPMCDLLFTHIDELAVHTESHFTPSTSSPSPPCSSLSARISLLCAGSGGVASVSIADHLSFHGTESWDQGFGCGYRNLQMLISCLLHSPAMRQAMQLNTLPSIAEIQTLIERGWSRGFDAPGARQLGGLLRGTRTWIGPSEVGVFLQDHNVRVEVVDAEHPTRGNYHHNLFAWITHYFHEHKWPIYIQHDGHSQTVIGVEQTTTGDTRLLLFDPNMDRERIAALETAGKPEAVAFLRRPIGHMRKPKYQLLVVRGILQSPSERDKAKTYNTTFNHSQIL